MPENSPPASGGVHDRGAVASNPGGRESSKADFGAVMESAGAAVRTSASTAARIGGGSRCQASATFSRSGSTPGGLLLPLLLPDVGVVESA